MSLHHRSLVGVYDVAGKRKTWVCAYANNQHDLASAIPADPKESSFYKAMQECDVHANLARRESFKQLRNVEIL